MELRAVGVVRSPIRERKQMTAWGVPASVEVFEPFLPALHRIDKHSHIWVLAWLDQPPPGREGDNRTVLQVTPRGVDDKGPEGLHGVFAVRSPARPNPIGLTAARVLAREGAVLHLDRLDFLDQTPVIDIKPYFVTRDLIFSANGRQVGHPRSREDLRESLTIQAVQFHGSLPPDIALGVRIVEHFRAVRHDMNDVVDWSVTAPLRRPVLMDSLIALTRTTPGRGTLRFHESATVDFAGEAIYTPSDGLPADAETILSLPDEALFTVRFL